MTNQHSPLRPATMKDLQDMLAHAAKHPAEQEKLAAAPEAALEQAGLLATADAIEFLQSLGHSKFDEKNQTPKSLTGDPTKGMGEL